MRTAVPVLFCLALTLAVSPAHAIVIKHTSLTENATGTHRVRVRARFDSGTFSGVNYEGRIRCFGRGCPVKRGDFVLVLAEYVIGIFWNGKNRCSFDIDILEWFPSNSAPYICTNGQSGTFFWP